MANKLRTNIDPSQVTIQNIGTFNQQTEDTIDQIRDTDIVSLQENISSTQENINNLANIYNTKMRLIQRTAPENPIQDMAWFIEQN